MDFGENYTPSRKNATTKRRRSVNYTACYRALSISFSGIGQAVVRYYSLGLLGVVMRIKFMKRVAMLQLYFPVL